MSQARRAPFEALRRVLVMLGLSAACAALAAEPIDINSASREQLRSLPGIGEAQAERIVAGRPYLSKADLVSKQGIPAGVYLSLRHQIAAIQTTKPKADGRIGKR
jgi:DNA uptake protein ComE-like DNA-binding protein